jgi:hypothetical protein
MQCPVRHILSPLWKFDVGKMENGRKFDFQKSWIVVGIIVVAIIVVMIITVTITFAT